MEKPRDLDQTGFGVDASTPGRALQWATAIEQWKAGGGLVVGCLGYDVPVELLLAGGCLPVRVLGYGGGRVAEPILEPGFDPLVARQFAAVINGECSGMDALVISNSSDAYVRLYYYLKELHRQGHPGVPPVYFFDWMHSPHFASIRYNQERMMDFVRVVEYWTGRSIREEEIRDAVAWSDQGRRLLEGLNEYRIASDPRISGTVAMETVLGTFRLLPAEVHGWIQSRLNEASRAAPVSGVRVYIAGSTCETTSYYQLIESCGGLVVGESHEFGPRLWRGRVGNSGPVLANLLEWYCGRPPAVHQALVRERIAFVLQEVERTHAECVIYLTYTADDAPAWDFPTLEKALWARGLPVLHLQNQPDIPNNIQVEDLKGTLRAFFERRAEGKVSTQHGSARCVSGVSVTDSREAPRTGGTGGGRPSRKRLATSAQATAYQKEWFASIRERVMGGEPFALVNADVPQEILRAMDIPYVVNQWWSSLCSAKQTVPRYLNLLSAHGYPTDLCRYCSISLASALDPDPISGPWGGLPKPSVVISRLTCDAQSKIFENMANAFGIPYYALENTVPQTMPERWWERVADEWESLFDPHRLAFGVEDLKGLIRFLEIHTGRTLRPRALEEVMDRVNRQAEFNRQTRDIIATARPSPVSIPDTIPSVMIPQWHRGTEWAVQMAQSLRDEVASLVAEGNAACAREQVRLMWLGRGLWHNLGFYQHFEERYGAVFIWSIYLAIAADGYARYGGDPLRALASRYAGMEDMLHMPPWNSDWYVTEAQRHGVQGVVHLVPNACTQGAGGTFFVRRALEQAGIPVLQIRADPVDRHGWDEDAMVERVQQFLESEVGVKPL